MVNGQDKGQFGSVEERQRGFCIGVTRVPLFRSLLPNGQQSFSSGTRRNSAILLMGTVRVIRSSDRRSLRTDKEHTSEHT